MSALTAADFGRVAVLMGGRSGEREISLQSGQAVLAALQRRGVDAVAVDPGPILPDMSGFDRVFVALHGRGGEDGAIQGWLEWLELPYTGSGIAGSALAMDKRLTKRLWQAEGLPTPGWAMMRAPGEAAPIVAELGLPLIVKPASEGSSLGMRKVDSVAALETAWAEAAKLDDAVLVERWIVGAEYTAAVLEGEALPLIRLETPHEFYDYAAKYQADSTQYHCPCGLPADQEASLRQLCLDAFRALELSGWGRVDFMLDAEGPWLLEANTVPGMTDHSLVPMAARAAGVDFDELVWRVLAGSLARATEADRCRA